MMHATEDGSTTEKPSLSALLRRLLEEDGLPEPTTDDRWSDEEEDGYSA
jgi:hypothetical protein